MDSDNRNHAGLLKCHVPHMYQKLIRRYILWYTWRIMLQKLQWLDKGLKKFAISGPLHLLCWIAYVMIDISCFARKLHGRKLFCNKIFFGSTFLSGYERFHQKQLCTMIAPY